MQRLAPHRLVHAPQLAERERFVEERGRERRVLQLGARPFDAVGDDARVVERERRAVVTADAVDREVVDAPRTARRRRPIRRRASTDAVKPTYATDTTRMRGSRSGRAVRAQLLEVAERDGVARRSRRSTPVSSCSSRRAASSRSSSGSTKPPGSAHWPRNGWPLALDEQHREPARRARSAARRRRSPRRADSAPGRRSARNVASSSGGSTHHERKPTAP